MKSIKALVIVALLTLIGTASASAQFKWGPRVGINTSKLHFDKSNFNTKNMTGFTGGLQIEFTAPIIGIGMDASVMYVNRGINDPIVELDNNGVAGSLVDNKHRSSYIEIPLNLKYKLGLPVVNNIVTPFIFTGPSFAFLCSSKTWQDMKRKSCDIAWNFGLGIELFRHLQVAASYGIGLNSAIERKLGGGGQEVYDGKNRVWTVTAAYLF
ncbi:MAG: PorT family protein [Muribaculaceae bacterium]|nr:PorT family protein [Muribaculaceae bacterium]